LPTHECTFGAQSKFLAKNNYFVINVVTMVGTRRIAPLVLR